MTDSPGAVLGTERSDESAMGLSRRSRRLLGLVVVLALAALIATACLVAANVEGVPTATSGENPAGNASAIPSPAAATQPHRHHDTGKNGVGGTYETPSHVPYIPTGFNDPRPNVLLITTDDQALTDLRWMPKTRQWLAAQGITFPHMLSPHPLCCPARAEIVTGQFAQNIGVHTNAGPYGGLPALKHPDNTLPWWLQQAHYQTAMVGKYLNGYTVETGVPRGWDYWNAATHNGFGYYNYVLYNNGNPKFYGHGDDANNSSTVIAADTTRLIHAYADD